MQILLISHRRMPLLELLVELQSFCMQIRHTTGSVFFVYKTASLNCFKIRPAMCGLEFKTFCRVLGDGGLGIMGSTGSILAQIIMSRDSGNTPTNPSSHTQTGI